MSAKLRKMLTERRPPGFGGRALDPGSPGVRIPQALKELEAKASARDIARGAGWSVDTLKRTWGI